MRRVSLHIVFWLLYILQDTLLAYTWFGPSLRSTFGDHLLIIAAIAALINIPPKLLITYFLLGVSIPEIRSAKPRLLRVALSAIFVFALSIFIYRGLSHYYTFPHLYKGLLKDGPMLAIPNVLVAMIDIGFIAGLAATIKFARIQLAGKEKEKALIKEKLEAELKFLRHQTNPHFLLNTLNNIYALARKRSEDTAEVVMKLSELLRFMLYESDGHAITLAEEIKIVEDYLELETIRYNDRLSVSFHKSIDHPAYRITPLLLLPFIENAFKHGISETRFESFIRIEIRATEGQLYFTIENTREDAPAATHCSNIGLANVRRRLELTYREYTLDTHSNDNTFIVHLFLNLNSYVEI